MYRVYLVDDDVYLRKGLKKHFEWEKYGATIIGEAENGKKALEELMNLKADIVITDVKMPQMDGIELACHLKEKGYKAKIIFISGYNDLDLLKSSIKLGAIDYILKPIDLEEFAETLIRVTNMVSVEDEKTALMHRMEQKLRQSMPILRERFLTRLVKDEISDYIDEQLEFLDIALKKDGKYCIMVVSVDNYYQTFRERNEHNRQLLSFAVLNILQELLEVYGSGYVFETRQGEYAIIIVIQKEEGFETDILNLASEMKNMLKKYLELESVVGIGQIVSGLLELKYSYREAVKAIEQKSYLGEDQVVAVFLYGNENAKSRRKAEWQELYKRILDGKQDEMLEMLRTYIRTEGGKSESGYKDSLFQMLNYPLSELEEYREFMDTRFTNPRRVYEKFFCCQNLKEMQDFVESLYMACFQAVQLRRENPTNAIIMQIKQYIKSKYAENMTVNDIAEAVYLTPTYVCLLFKQQTGTTINNYLTEVRIRKAKELLRDSKKKLYDICLLVGYTSPSYFSKLFKKMTGYTPSEYRDMSAVDERQER